MPRFLQYICFVLLSLGSFFTAFADDAKDFPPKPEPIHYVNDLAGMLQPGEDAQLEAKLRQYEEQTSTQITIVTIKSLGNYEVAQYAAELGNRWGVGQKGKDNGVLILASLDDHKINISTGYGLEGALTDAQCGRIIRNEIVPSFKEGNYYAGFDKAADAVIAATKGEYKPDEQKADKRQRSPGGSVALILIILVIVWVLSRRGGGGGGSYMSGRGSRDLITGAILGNLLGGGGRGGWGGGGGGGGWGGGSSGGGSFGGGGFGGGGASGSW